MEELIQKVQDWAVDKGIDKPENWSKQYVKVVEELGELGSAILKDKREDEKDAFADVLVTIIILSLQRGVNLKTELEKVYEIISKRTGKNINGVFVKD